MDGKLLPDILYRVEAKPRLRCPRRPVESRLFPRSNSTREQDATLIASTRIGKRILAMSPEDSLRAEYERRSHLIAAAHPAIQDSPAAELVLAADQFLITPVGRIADAARAHAAGDEAAHRHRRLSLVHRLGPRHHDQPGRLDARTGRQVEAGYILRTFAHYVRDGLIPNLFPRRRKRRTLSHRRRHALVFPRPRSLSRRTLRTARRCGYCSRSCVDIVEHHMRGTRFGIGVDPADGLLRRGRKAISSPGWTPRWATGS